MSSFLVFNRVYRLEIQSVMLVGTVFRPSFVDYCPSNLLSCSPPPLFPKSKYSLYRQRVARRVWGGGVWVVLETIFCRSLTFCFWRDSEPTKFLFHQTKPRKGDVLRHINTCHKVTLQVNFFRQRHMALLSISLIFLRAHRQPSALTGRSDVRMRTRDMFF